MKNSAMMTEMCRKEDERFIFKYEKRHFDLLLEIFFNLHAFIAQCLGFFTYFLSTKKTWGVRFRFSTVLDYHFPVKHPSSVIWIFMRFFAVHEWHWCKHPTLKKYFLSSLLWEINKVCQISIKKKNFVNWEVMNCEMYVTLCD